MRAAFISRAKLQAHRLLPAAMAAAVGLTGAVWGPRPVLATPGPVAEAAVSAAADEPSARLQALRTGKRVEVPSATTETVRVFANPSGSMTAEISAVPQRVRRTDGGWTAVDTRLVFAGGVVRPAATLSPVAFSAGGAGPLAELTARGGSLAYRWDRPLPIPVLEGDTAVYPEVYPGVDLRVRALVDGFSYALVVKTRAAAANPALKTIRLGVTGDRLTVAARSGGGLTARTRDGKAAVSAGGALMWDQRGAEKIEVTSADRERMLPGAGESVRERVLRAKDVLAAPADLARKSSLKVSFGDGRLTVHTDLSLLRDPDAEFPIVIDPVSRTIPGAGAPHWGFASSDNENRTDGIARVGPDPDEYSSVWRSFFGFPVTSTVGGPATITGAAFQTWLVHSGACQAKPVNLYGAGGFGAGRSNWPGASLDIDLGTQHGNANKSACPQPDMFMEWKNDAVKNYVQQELNQGEGSHNFALAVANINGENLWKKFDPNRTSLWVEWNKKPVNPVATDMVTAADATSSDIPCVGTPWVRGRTPALRAALRDPDNEEGGVLTGTFTWQQWNGSAWQAGGSLTKTAPPATPSAPGNRAEVTLPQLAENVKHRWQLTTTDSGGLVSDPSPWCEFVVASAPPAQKPTVASTDYPTSGINGAVGQSGRFTFGAGGASSVTAYTYWLEGGPARTVTTAAPGGSVSGVVVTPTAIGQNTLHVMSRDSAGNSSDEILYKFSVGGEQSPVSHWALSDSWTDTGSTPRTATVFGTPVYTIGRHGGAVGGDRAMFFDGGQDYTQVPAAVVDHGKAITVAAWVRLPDPPTQDGVLLSSGTAAEGVFELRYRTAGGWCFTGIFVNAGARQPADACTGAGVAVGEWTYVVGVYDPSATEQLAVYVDGVRAGHRLVNVSFEAAAEFVLGGGRRAGAVSALFRGEVSDVKVWRQALTPDRLQIKEELVPKAPGRWDLNDYQLDPFATDAADHSGHANTLTLSGDAGFDTEFIDPVSEERDLCSDSADYTGAVRFGKAGSPGSLGAAGTILDTASSYTASAFVCVADGDRGRQVALAHRGTTADGFAILYDAGGWQAEIADNDPGTSTVTTATNSAPVAAQEWHHVALVFDAAERTATLYVDGQPGAPAPLPAGFVPGRAGGALVVGRGIAAGDWLSGTVDTVRVYAHALTAAQVAQVNNAAEPTYPVNRAPGAPTGVTIAGQSGTELTLSDTTPDFAATFTDPDADKLWFQVSLTSGATSAEATATTRAVPGTQTLAWPTDVSPDWPAQLTQGVVYTYRVRAYDGVAYGPWSGSTDVIVPKPGAVNHPPTPTVTVAAKNVRVALAPRSGDVGLVAGYRYGTDPLNLVGTVLTARDGKAELQFAPTVPTTVYFQSVMADGVANPGMGDGKPRLSKAVLNPLTGTPTAKRYDLEGDGRADVIGLMDVGGVAMPYLASATTGTATTSPALPLGGLSYPPAVTEHGVGDIDGDKRADLVVLTETAGALRLKVLRYNGVGFTETDTGFVPQTGMNADRTRLMVGDVTGDGKDDVTVAFDDQNGHWTLWVSPANGGTTFFGASSRWYQTPYGSSDYRQIKWFMGDFDGDGKDDVGEFYNYVNCQTRFFSHRSTGAGFPDGSMKWDSGVGNWCQDRAAITPVDYENNATDDLAVSYRYDGCATRIWRFVNTPDAGQPGGFSTAGVGDLNLGVGWCGEKLAMMPGDYNGDTTGDLRLLYHCCGADQHQLWAADSYFGQSLQSAGLSREFGLGPIGTTNLAVEPWQPYQIVASSSEDCLTAPEGSLGNTIQAVATSCTADEFKAFDIYHDNRGEHHRISFRHSQKCLNVRYASLDDGGLVDQYDCQFPQANNEAWQIRPVGGAQDPLVEIVSVNSGKCLQVPPNVFGPMVILEKTVTQSACTGVANQRFYLRKVVIVPSGTAGWWKMNEAAGSATLADSSGNGKTATLYGGATVGNGYATFNGTTAFAQTAGRVPYTGASFTVSAWVRLPVAQTTFRTAVSQDGVNQPAFELGLGPYSTSATWQIEKVHADTTTPTAWAVASAGAAASTGTWVHLTAVYDHRAGQLRLYRNGLLVSGVPCTYVWNSTGKFTIGKALHGDFWPGDVDDVRVWNRVLSPAEISTVKQARA